MKTRTWVFAAALVIFFVLGYWYWSAHVAPSPAPGNPVPNPELMATRDRATIAGELSGVWVSTQDAKFTREFDTNGTVIDRYAGTASTTMTGIWSVVPDPAAEPVQLPAVDGQTVIKLEFPAESVMYFAITSATATDLSMNYLNGNGALEFTKVTQ
ncbi:MAG: hypothetical protein KGI41_03105 [Patescibacteria group bacterium]|nr:hypothetical protein [Patescibacteria group bacterium]MDE1966203.1 hypothetical protein [Patescibacteria group bacterium]